MFLHVFKYNLMRTFRQKDTIFWLIIFPIVLGTFFKVAFSNIYKDSIFTAIPVAIVADEKNEVFDQVIKQVSTGDDALFKVEYTDKESALDMLNDKDVSGIIFTKDLSLSVSADGIKPTIIKSFLEQYKVREKIITDTAAKNPQNLEAVVSALSNDVQSNENIPLGDTNMDPFLSYFYNLIAMVALLSSQSGLYIAINNQGNLSPIGARKCCAPTHKLVSIIASMLSQAVTQILCAALSVTFIRFVLNVDFGSNLPLVYLASSIGALLGLSLGFFIGSIGRMGTQLKNAISMAVSMSSCFLSGLMIADIKPIIIQYMPWFNKINPAAVISDSFYCLQIYSDYGRFIEKIITMIILTVIFAAGGFFLTRRQKYASI